MRREMKPSTIIASSFLATLMATLPAADWPTYQRSAARSGTTTEELTLPLTAGWTYASSRPPIPAWDEPALWDGYNKAYNLRNRLDFDKAFHVAAVGGRVYFGSSVDDKIYCLDAASGKEQWVYFTGGPVRLAPTVHNGRLYCGSDDGQLYALEAETGKLIWRRRVAPERRVLPGNGRLISLWPVRTGAVVINEKVYCAAGLFPTQGVHVAAFDAKSGELVWRQKYDDLPAQGYMLGSSTRLYVPTGRGAPIVFDRKTGKRLYEVKGAGGTYALLTGEHLVTTSGRDGRGMSVFGAGSRDHLASFRGNHMIITSTLSYLHSDEKLTALDRKRYLELNAAKRKVQHRRDALAKQHEAMKKRKAPAAELEAIRAGLSKSAAEIEAFAEPMRNCYLWEIKTSHPFSLILAGDHLFAGGRDSVAAFRVSDGRETWQAPADGNVYGLAVANGRLFASTDHGRIHSFAGVVE